MSGKCLMVGDSRMTGIGKNKDFGKLQSQKNVTVGVKVKKNGRTITLPRPNDVVGQGKDGNYYYASGGQSYEWFKANVSQIAETAKEQNCDYVVINMGVNDWPNFLNKTSDGGGVNKAGAQKMANNYLTLAKQIEKQSGKKVVFVTPYPLHGNYERNQYSARYDYSRKSINAGLEEFNSYLSAGAEQNGFGFIDIYTKIKSDYLDNKNYWTDGVHGSENLHPVIINGINEGLGNSPVRAKAQTLNQTQPSSPLPTSAERTSVDSSQQKKIDANQKSESTGNTAQSQLTARQIRNMKGWAKRVGLSEDVVQQLQEKYGANAHKLMMKAMMEPAYLMKKLGRGHQSSKKTIEMLLHLEDDNAQKLLRGYRLQGKVNKTQVSPSNSSPAEPVASQPKGATNNPAVRSSVASIDFSNPRVFNTIVDHVYNVRKIAYSRKNPKPTKSETETIVRKIITESVKKGIDPCLALAVAETESHFITDAASPAGAYGLFQLMPNNITGFKGNRKDVWQNISGGIGFLASNQTAYKGDLLKTLVAYNAGSGNLRKAERRGLHGVALDKITDKKCYAKTVLKKLDEYRELIGGNSYAYAQYYNNTSSERMLANQKSNGRLA